MGAPMPSPSTARSAGWPNSIDDAQRRLSAVLAGILQAVALAGNAAVASPLMISAHGMDLSHPQPFLGYRTPDGPEWFPPGIDGLKPLQRWP